MRSTVPLWLWLVSVSGALPVLEYRRVHAKYLRQLAFEQPVDSFPYMLWVPRVKWLMIVWLIIIGGCWIWYFAVRRRRDGRHAGGLAGNSD